jgi:hypothetical protein
MLVMRTIEDPTNPLGELVSAQRIALRLHYFALASLPTWVYGVEPRTLLGQQAADDPHSLCALFDFSVVRSEPASDLAAYVPGSVVPDEYHDLLADLLELLKAPLKQLGRFGTYGSTLPEAQPPLIDFGHIWSA